MGTSDREHRQRAQQAMYEKMRVQNEQREKQRHHYFKGGSIEDTACNNELTYSPKERSEARQSQEYGRTIDQSGLVVYKDATISQDRQNDTLLTSKYGQRYNRQARRESQ